MHREPRPLEPRERSIRQRIISSVAGLCFVCIVGLVIWELLHPLRSVLEFERRGAEFTCGNNLRRLSAALREIKEGSTNASREIGMSEVLVYLGPGSSFYTNCPAGGRVYMQDGQPHCSVQKHQEFFEAYEGH
jgi:hypothetical protein